MSQIQLALVAAMRDISKTGIAKTSRADTGMAKYNFRGIEAAMNEMSPILVRHGITVTSRFSELNVMERSKGEGKATRFVTLKGSFTFAAEDGSSVTAEAYGEAMDSGDKAVIKAQSVSFRTALFTQFVVPTMAMDTEDDAGTDSGEVSDLLDEFQAAAMQGTTALRAAYDARKPNAAFWKAHSDSLKRAAQAADKEVRQ